MHTQFDWVNEQMRGVEQLPGYTVYKKILFKLCGRYRNFTQH